LSLSNLTAELRDAYDDPATRKGAQEMHASVERLLQLLGHK
jgi:hypothetical protein